MIRADETRETRPESREPVSRVAYVGSSLDPPPVMVVNGAGVLAEQPVIVHTQLPTTTIGATSRRRLVESAVLFIGAILFLRTMAVEPFGVPTGSMAPTFCGNHRAMACSRCGFPVRVGEPTNKRDYPETHCPNCGAINLALGNAPDIAGDRLLVDKNVFRLRSPRRWEVAVFICPVDKSKPYVKRVIGRPNEKILVQDGDIWIDGELARKSLSEARESRVLIFDSDYVPPGGWDCRWLEDGVRLGFNINELPKLPEWMQLQGTELFVDAKSNASPRLAAYWHNTFDDWNSQVIRDGFEYNGHSLPQHDYAVHDFILQFEVEVLAGTGSVICKLTDGQDEPSVEIAAGSDFGESKLLLPKVGQVKAANRDPLKAGKKHLVEMALVDRRISLAVNGTEYFTHDLPPAGRREDVNSPFRIGGQGVSLAIRHVKLYRDIYYRPGDRHAASTPFQLGSDEYFMMGDNSANSDDSRSWQIPGVPERNFLGKPFLLHQPSRPTQWGVGGRKVDSQSIDWDRIRWLR